MRWMYATAIVLAGAVVCLYAFRWTTATDAKIEVAKSPEELVEEALDSADVATREQATVQLATIGRPALPQLRELASRSDDHQVRAAAVQGLGELYDYESMDHMLMLMDDPSPLVRARAFAAVRRMTGLDNHFNPEGPVAERRMKIQFYREQWSRTRDTPNMDDFKKRVDKHLDRGGR